MKTIEYAITWPWVFNIAWLLIDCRHGWFRWQWIINQYYYYDSSNTLSTGIACREIWGQPFVLSNVQWSPLKGHSWNKDTSVIIQGFQYIMYRSMIHPLLIMCNVPHLRLDCTLNETHCYSSQYWCMYSTISDVRTRTISPHQSAL